MIMVRSFFRSEIDHSINCAKRQDAAPASLFAEQVSVYQKLIIVELQLFIVMYVMLTFRSDIEKWYG